MQCATQNDDHCAQCGKGPSAANRGKGKLLCCELCPRVYHLGCLEPPLTAVPRGAWHCPECSGVVPLQHVERIMAVRPLQVCAGTLVLAVCVRQTTF